MPTDQPYGRSRPEDMPILAWLEALEEIRQLKARRDRYVDAHDWTGYAALHAPDHVSYHAPDPVLGSAPEPWRSVDEMMDNIRKYMPDSFYTAHHSYDPEISFETPTKARGIWAMTAASVTRNAGGNPVWAIGYGYYFETYERRNGYWLFTSRRWQRHFGIQSSGGSDAVDVTFPQVPLRGTDAFAAFDQAGAGSVG